MNQLKHKPFIGFPGKETKIQRNIDFPKIIPVHDKAQCPDL